MLCMFGLGSRFSGRVLDVVMMGARSCHLASKELMSEYSACNSEAGTVKIEPILLSTQNKTKSHPPEGWLAIAGRWNYPKLEPMCIQRCFGEQGG